MIERLREGRLRETCMKEKREKKAIREEGEQESEEDRMEKERKRQGLPSALGSYSEKGKRDGRTWRGLCDRGIPRRISAREQGGSGESWQSYNPSW